ncbi:MFS transporter [Photorhabdus sp. SF281]|uniref:MFS transporter n=1 Tax=Photorhabdus sp. SF281 TaxID=3459527 RepID=UPI00404481F5
MSEKLDLLPLITFVRGFLFWAAATAAIGYIPLLVEATDFSATQAAIFLSGTAIGRVVFQPIMGQFISPKNCLQVYAGALIGLISCSICLFLFRNPINLLLCSRLLEGAFFSGFIISWRTQLNRFSQASNFESVNDSYVISQNAGRLVGPMAGGIIAAKFDLYSVFLFSAIMYSLCLIILPQKTAITSIANHNREQIRITYVQLIRRNWRLLLVHHLEFICLGLWLASWPIFAVYTCGFSPIEVGYSFAIAAAGGFFVLPLRKLLRKTALKARFVISLMLLFLQPSGALLISTHLGLWIMLLLGGLGSTIYFTSFHQFVSKTYPVEQIPAIYGFLGTSTFLAQAIGQAVTPYTQQFGGIDAPIIIDAILLFIMILIAFRIYKKGSEKYDLF